ncbi:MAG: hypothetical protein LBE81_04860 [Azonexus sp.]|uniref:hypothetical protein n=1 Tax=Azonexus sp. TaxID=1872668 RepID=UPI00282B8B50|nr:hypothetical protein [Azonexus sp.]MDR0775951.1 hypothetical protein [Azonexus sp.]
MTSHEAQHKKNTEISMLKAERAELLEALNNLLSLYTDHSERGTAVYRRARAAIAQASLDEEESN